MTDPLDIRIGHAERDEAVEKLRVAAGEGRLTLDELDGRIERALSARTRGDVQDVLVDLLPSTELEAVVNPAVVAAAQVKAPGWSWQDPLALTARWEEVVRAGPWEVPPFLELNPVASNVKLNFVDARTTGDLIDVVVNGGAGNAVLIVPPGWGVDTSRVEKNSMGVLKTSVDQRPRPGQPLLVVRGRTAIGNIVARYPNRFDTWQRDRRLAKGGGIVAKN
ncbi:MAG TPA: DUF1707 domain-containing protein [Propionibacterium sp.]|nr:DUF1707 domain-containing protein [Propionibacterium sp.]